MLFRVMATACPRRFRQAGRVAGSATVSIGTNLVSVSATDENGNSATNVYQLVVPNNVATRTLLYDLNGNLTNDAGATLTNRTEFAYDGQGRRARAVEKQGGARS